MFLPPGTYPAWNEYILTRMVKWQNYITNLILRAPTGCPRLVVRYEDVQRDRVREVERMLDFLYIRYTKETLKEKLEKDFTIFQRKSRPEFEHFTILQVEHIQQVLTTVLEQLKKENNGVTFRIEEYLR